VMAPTPGGIYYRQLAPLLRAVAKRNRVVGIDLVEVAPSYDFKNGLTSVMAGRLILNAIAGTRD
ncbi:MAG: arginase family protein, partial [Reyranellaceae bacterium]